MLVLAMGIREQEGTGEVYLSCWGSKKQEEIKVPICHGSQ